MMGVVRKLDFKKLDHGKANFLHIKQLYKVRLFKCSKSNFLNFKKLDPIKTVNDSLTLSTFLI